MPNNLQCSWENQKWVLTKIIDFICSQIRPKIERLSTNRTFDQKPTFWQKNRTFDQK